MLAQNLATVLSEEHLHHNVNVFNAPLPTQRLEQVLRLVVGVSLLRQESVQEVATPLAFNLAVTE